jgi:hypothetical protein
MHAFMSVLPFLRESQGTVSYTPFIHLNSSTSVEHELLDHQSTYSDGKVRLSSFFLFPIHSSP